MGIMTNSIPGVNDSLIHCFWIPYCCEARPVNDPELIHVSRSVKASSSAVWLSKAVWNEVNVSVEIVDAKGPS